jgi:hypothetical protein
MFWYNFLFLKLYLIFYNYHFYFYKKNTEFKKSYNFIIETNVL